MLTLSNLIAKPGDKILYEEVSVQINRGEKSRTDWTKRCRKKYLDQKSLPGRFFLMKARSLSQKI